MVRKAAGTPPSELQRLLKDISEAITAISRGEDPEQHMESVYRATDSAIRAATSLAPRAPLNWGTPLPASFGEIVGENIRALRIEAQWSQEEVATSMARVGFSWKRLTVTEVEGAARRLSFEELLALAALFAIPAIELMLPSTGTALEWPHGVVDAPTMLELLLGRRGSVGEGGVRWRAPIVALGSPTAQGDYRPGVDLWRNRRTSVGGTTRAKQQRADS